LGGSSLANGLSGFEHLAAANKELRIPRKMLGQSEL
jgi:hypothetical protein